MPMPANGRAAPTLHHGVMMEEAIKRVAFGRHRGAKGTSLAAYRDVAGELLDELRHLADSFKGIRICHINSSASGGYSPAHTFIFSAKSSLTMLTTNSLVASMLTSVSFLGRSPPRIIGIGTKPLTN